MIPRRRILQSGCATTASWFLVNVGTTKSDDCVATAATPTTPGEAIRRSAVRIPGFGDSDVFYPLVLLGRWNTTREETLFLSSSTTTTTTTPAAATTKTTSTTTYPIRFIQSIQDDAVVMDRGFSQASLEKAVHPDRPVRSYQWTETNPNDLRLQFQDGGLIDSKVTKRATQRTEETVESSEFQRITIQQPDDPVPVLAAQRVLSKWKIVNNTNVEAIQVVYDMPSLGDPLGMDPGSMTAGPKMVAKVKLHLQRL